MKYHKKNNMKGGYGMTQELRKYDVILVDFGKDFIGSEQGGVRPAVIVQNNKGNKFSTTTLVFPLTSKIYKTNLPTHTVISKGDGKGLYKNSLVLGECIRQISEKRIVGVLGKITDIREKMEIKRVYNANFDDGEE